MGEGVEKPYLYRDDSNGGGGVGGGGRKETIWRRRRREGVLFLLLLLTFPTILSPEKNGQTEGGERGVRANLHFDSRIRLFSSSQVWELEVEHTHTHTCRVVANKSCLRRRVCLLQSGSHKYQEGIKGEGMEVLGTTSNGRRRRKKRKRWKLLFSVVALAPKEGGREEEEEEEEINEGGRKEERKESLSWTCYTSEGDMSRSV